MKVVVAGPPHSGKSVFLGGLCACLPRDMRYLFRACPDGEGTWTWRNASAASYRRKGVFSVAQVDWYVEKLRTNSLAPITLVDIGGRTSEENRRILKEGEVQYGIILSGDPAAIPEWENFLRDCGVQVLASIHSDYNGQLDVTDAPIMSVHHLERGEDVSSRPTIQHVAAMLLDMVENTLEAKMKTVATAFMMTILWVAEQIGLTPTTKTLPNGRIVTGLDWDGSHLPAIAKRLHNGGGWTGNCIQVDGAGPAWLMAALVHELHPSHVSLNSPDGFVGVGCQKPEGAGNGPNLSFKVETKGDWVVVTAAQVDPSLPLRPSDMDTTAPPALPMGAKVVLSGRMPNWAMASFAMAYHGTASACACFQPGVGATVAWTHTSTAALGSLIQI